MHPTSAGSCAISACAVNPPARVSGCGLRVSGFGFRVSGFGVSCFVFRVSCFVFRVSGFGVSPQRRRRACTGGAGFGCHQRVRREAPCKRPASVLRPFDPPQSSNLILQRSETGVVMLSVLPSVGRRDPRPVFFVGALQPTVGNTGGMVPPFSVQSPLGT